MKMITCRKITMQFDSDGSNAREQAELVLNKINKIIAHKGEGVGNAQLMADPEDFEVEENEGDV